MVNGGRKRLVVPRTGSHWDSVLWHTDEAQQDQWDHVAVGLTCGYWEPEVAR